MIHDELDFVNGMGLGRGFFCMDVAVLGEEQYGAAHSRSICGSAVDVNFGVGPLKKASMMINVKSSMGKMLLRKIVNHS